MVIPTITGNRDLARGLNVTAHHTLNQVVTSTN